MRTIEVKGKQYPVFGLLIERIFSPLKPQQLTMPPAPAGLTGKEWIKWHNETTLELEEAIKAERKRWLASREPVTRIEIEFMAWKWFGGIAGLHIETIDGGRLDAVARSAAYFSSASARCVALSSNTALSSVGASFRVVSQV